MPLIDAAKKMKERMKSNREPSEIDKSNLEKGILSNKKEVTMPGGEMYDYKDEETYQKDLSNYKKGIIANDKVSDQDYGKDVGEKVAKGFPKAKEVSEEEKKQWENEQDKIGVKKSKYVYRKQEDGSVKKVQID